MKNVFLETTFKFSLILFILTCHTPLFSQKVHYSIQAQLDDKHYALDGVLKLKYTNTSPGTITFIWFQLWPNAFKNDRTAYSEQLLDSGRTDFYFSDKEQKGFINRLAFRSGTEVLAQEDHPQFADLVKVNLSKPLIPGETAQISTPFHVQLPYNFSGFGHVGQSYMLRNWYPQVCSFNGMKWQVEPFTGQRSAAVADFEVTIILPVKYAIRTDAQLTDSSFADTKKTMRYHAENINDFAWTAERPGLKHPLPKKTFDERMAEVTPKILAKKILPAVGYNVYDGFQLGIVLHNFRIPENTFTYFISPMYAFNSKTVTGFAGINYNAAPGNYFKKISLGFNAARFSYLKGADSMNNKIFGSFYKVSPYARFTFPARNHHNEDWIELRTFVIGERNFDYARYSVDSFYYPVEAKTKTRYLHQLTFNHTSYRALYPYDAQLQVQQAKDFYRVNAEAHYFFNYAGGGGLQARIFAAKFGNIGNASSSDTYRYQPKLTAVRGDEDYTYGNSFAGRNEFNGFASQQIMMRDGGLKLRTDLFQDLQGRSDNWVASMNLNTSLPNKIFPKGFPLKIFLDAGTYAGAWKKETSQPRFLYVSGLQLSLFKNLINIYAPLLYSKTFKDNLKTVPEENTFLKKISFSIDFNGFLNTRGPGS